MLDYCKPINPQEVLIVFFDELRASSSNHLAQKICQKYNLNFIVASSLKDVIYICQNSKFKINHFIVRVSSKFNIQTLDCLRGILTDKYVSGSVAFSYQNQEEALLYASIVNQEKTTRKFVMPKHYET